jgi:hypothetical protein
MINTYYKNVRAINKAYFLRMLAPAGLLLLYECIRQYVVAGEFFQTRIWWIVLAFLLIQTPLAYWLSRKLLTDNKKISSLPLYSAMATMTTGSIYIGLIEFWEGGLSAAWHASSGIVMFLSLASNQALLFRVSMAIIVYLLIMDVRLRIQPPINAAAADAIFRRVLIVLALLGVLPLSQMAFRVFTSTLEKPELLPRFDVLRYVVHYSLISAITFIAGCLAAYPVWKGLMRSFPVRKQTE